MSTVHLFNPENDLALALGCRHYTPPPHAAALHRAGALLPAWWCEEDDTVIAPYPEADEDSDWLKERFGLEITIHTPGRQTDKAQPWGWSADAKRQMLTSGVDPMILPDDETLRHLRSLSHRRTASGLLKAMGYGHLAGTEITDPDMALEIEARRPGHFFKSPWSCSGRGVFNSRGLTSTVLREKCAGIIHRQGSIMAEPGCDKIAEIGALFFSHGIDSPDPVEWLGLSTFITEERGAYTGNIAAPQETIIQTIDSYGLWPETETAIRLLTVKLSTLVGGIYHGPLGVDMMIFRDVNTGKPMLHPCIEVNLRNTMGVVAMHIVERLGLTDPHIMSWQRITGRPSDSLTLLPPREGFALTLTPTAINKR